MSESFEAFLKRVPSFDALSPIDKICHVAWYLHSVRKLDYVSTSSINSCFDEVHAVPPHTSVYIRRMAERKPPLFLKSRAGYRLEGKRRQALEAAYGARPATIAVTKLLTDLSAKMATTDERRFLEETLNCYAVSAFRATVVMAWNLAYDHLQRWLVSDDARLASFNVSLGVKYPKKAFTLASVDDLSEFKEFEVVETCLHAKIITKNVAEIMKEKLKRRNAAAHPSSIVLTQAQADDVITDLVNNVVGRLI